MNSERLDLRERIIDAFGDPFEESSESNDSTVEQSEADTAIEEPHTSMPQPQGLDIAIDGVLRSGTAIEGASDSEAAGESPAVVVGSLWGDTPAEESLNSNAVGEPPAVVVESIW